MSHFSDPNLSITNTHRLPRGSDVISRKGVTDWLSALGTTGLEEKACEMHARITHITLCLIHPPKQHEASPSSAQRRRGFGLDCGGLAV